MSFLVLGNLFLCKICFRTLVQLSEVVFIDIYIHATVYLYGFIDLQCRISFI